MRLSHPYRTPAMTPDEGRGEAPRDDYVLGALLLALGGWRVAIAIASDERWGTEPTIAAIMTGLGVLLLLTTLARR